MLFNSIEYLIFLPLVLLLYWKVFNRRSIQTRNGFLLAASYFFYGWWDYRFLGLIILSSVVDYICGIWISYAKEQAIRKTALFISLTINIGILFFFKYFGFFATELEASLAKLGISLHFIDLKIVLPVGISFYTFQSLSYTIDIYRKKIEPTHNLITFLTYVAFFPQLVAGPIERATHLLPQFNLVKEFDYSKLANGFRQILWGFFAKVAVADSIAPIVDIIFTQEANVNAPTLVFGAILFSIQIFGDFAGYSNIAIGTASLFGFNLMENFRTPYFSRNIREFWSRWHISLSTWFRDYVYIPLGGNRCSKLRYAFNIVLTFTASGLWHGANWTFLTWGFLHGMLYLLTTAKQMQKSTEKASLKHLPSIFLTFGLVTFALIIFRAENITQAFDYLSRIVLLKKGVGLLQLSEVTKIIPAVFFSLVLFVAEWFTQNKKHALDIVSYKKPIRYLIYYLIIFAVLFSFQTDRIFIYFQF